MGERSSTWRWEGSLLGRWTVSALVFGAWVWVRLSLLPDVRTATFVDLLSLAILVTTTLSFERGDPPRRAWALLASAQGINALGIALRDQPALAAWADYWMYPYALVNACLATGMFVFWINGRASGLAPKWTTPWRVVAATVIAGAALVSASLLVSVFDRWASTGFSTAPLALGEAVMSASSAVADAIVFSCAILLARIFLPMAGGQIARPYLLLTVSGLLYLVLDVFTVYYGASGMPEAVMDRASFVFAAAEAGMMSAAVAHATMVLPRRKVSTTARA